MLTDAGLQPAAISLSKHQVQDLCSQSLRERWWSENDARRDSAPLITMLRHTILMFKEVGKLGQADQLPSRCMLCNLQAPLFSLLTEHPVCGGDLVPESEVIDHVDSVLVRFNSSLRVAKCPEEAQHVTRAAVALGLDFVRGYPGTLCDLSLCL